jgi:hypothetical protein
VAFDGSCAVFAVRPSTVSVREPAPRLSVARWRAWFAGLGWGAREGAHSNA